MRRVTVLAWLRRSRSIGGVLASGMLAFVLTVQSGVVCPDGTHGGGRHSATHAGRAMHQHGAAMAMHHHPSGTAPMRVAPASCDAPVDAARVPLCCWALANCASLAAPAVRGTADTDAVRTRETPVVALMAPRALAFAPDTPPPKV
jgi:hypothetical protein